jgi:toxin ParE1/3/4
MRLRYSRRALRHIDDISTYLEQRSPSATRQISGRIRDAISMLLEFPEVGRSGAKAGTREFPIPGLPYVIVYRVYLPAGDAGELRIAGIYHAARLRPGQARPPKE